MNQVLIRAVIVVTLALIFYSIGIITEQKKENRVQSSSFISDAGYHF